MSQVNYFEKIRVIITITFKTTKKPYGCLKFASYLSLAVNLERSRLTVHYCLPGFYVASEMCFVYCVFFEKVQFKKFLEKLIPRKPFASNDLTAIWRLVSKKKNHEIS